MILTIALISIIIICVVIMTVIASRHFSQLAAVDLQNLPQEKAGEIKDKIIESRLRRKLGQNVNTFYNKFIVPFSVKLFTKIKQIYHKALDLEKYYKREIKIKSTENLSSIDKKGVMEEKIKKARELIEKNEFKQAEELFIEAVSLDSTNVNAYLGLARVYVGLKDFEHAHEVYGHVLKLDAQNGDAMLGLADLANKENDWLKAAKIYEDLLKVKEDEAEYYYDYALVSEKLEDNKKAIEAAQTAVELKPNDPRYLDLLIEMCIVNKKKFLALKTLDKLKEVNPENQKLAELKNRIGEI